MKQKKVKLIAILLTGISLAGVQAQEALPASGGNALGSGGTASYIIGQALYTSNSGTGGSESQGVQQPYEISTVTNLEELNDKASSFSVYPNPASDILILKIEGEIHNQYVMSLYDMNGKLLENKNIESTETGIDTKNLVPAAYFLKITENNNEVQLFKILKN